MYWLHQGCYAELTDFFISNFYWLFSVLFKGLGSIYSPGST